MVCKNCGNQQETGKFCGKCGSNLVESAGQAPEQLVKNESALEETAATIETAQPNPTPTQPVQQNQHVETVKNASKLYWDYFKQYIKKPSQIFANQEREFLNGTISIVIFSALIAIIFYNLANKVSKLVSDATYGISDLLGGGPKFFPLFTKAFLLTILSLAIVAISIYTINKLFGPGNTNKEIIAVYGTILTPLIILEVAALLLILLDSFFVGGFILGIIFTLSLSIIPYYILSTYLSKKTTRLDSFYGVAAYYVMSSILFFIYSIIFLTQLFKEMFSLIDNITSFF